MMAMSMLDQLHAGGRDGAGRRWSGSCLTRKRSSLSPMRPRGRRHARGPGQDRRVAVGGVPRTFLKQALAELAGEGYSMQAAFEPEFTIGRREISPAAPSIPDRLIPIDDSLCYSSTGFHLGHEFTMELVAAMEDQGLEVEHYYPELGTVSTSSPSGPPTRCAPPTTTCLYRETVRGVAFRRGLWGEPGPQARFHDQAGKRHSPARLARRARVGRLARRAERVRRPDRPQRPVPRWATTSSAACSRTARPGRADLRQREQLPPARAADVGQRLHLLRDGQPGGGDQDLLAAAAANRAVRSTWSSSRHDSSANPYLASARSSYAGLDGIRGKLDPGEAVNVDPGHPSPTPNGPRVTRTGCPPR